MAADFSSCSIILVQIFKDFEEIMYVSEYSVLESCFFCHSTDSDFKKDLINEHRFEEMILSTAVKSSEASDP